jgi:hypothetical protein
VTVYHDIDWPWGLRCMDCGIAIVEGEFYSERLTGFQDDNPIVEIVCAVCVLKESS